MEEAMSLFPYYGATSGSCKRSKSAATFRECVGQAGVTRDMSDGNNFGATFREQVAYWRGILGFWLDG